MLSETKVTPRIEKNVVQAFKISDSHGVCHKDVRPANVLVRKDEKYCALLILKGVVLNGDTIMLLEEEDEVRHMLQFAKRRA